MKNEKGRIRIGSLITFIILIIILIICFKIYKINYFNGFEKATVKQEGTTFIRDSKVKYLDNTSYKIENTEYNDSTFYKEIEVEPNTPYKISCMVKTKNVECETDGENGGVVIGLLDTTEYSAPITGTNDWQLIEFMFNSRNREKVKISFRLGGNDTNCTGTAWFAEPKLERGIDDKTIEWNVGCFIIKNLDVNIDMQRYNLKTNTDDITNVRLNMKRFQEDCYTFSNGAMKVKYDILEVNTPITTITYSEEHGYYISYKDVKEAMFLLYVEWKMN